MAFSRRLKLDLLTTSDAPKQKLKRRSQNIALSYVTDTIIDGQVSLAEFGSTSVQNRRKAPAIEWWDEPVVENSSYSAVKVENITGNLFIPPALPPATTTYAPPPQEIMLTKKERKKIRRQRRMAVVREIQEKIRTGELPPPPPKVKISNMARVLNEQMVANPTEVEKLVREAERKRREAHEKRNQDRKLSKEERREKIVNKVREDLKKACVLALFRIGDLSNSKLRFRVKTNAVELHLTGMCLMVFGQPGMQLVLVEGPPQNIKKYINTMTKRINWGMPFPLQAQAAPAATGESSQQSDQAQDPSSSTQPSPASGSASLRFPNQPMIPIETNFCKLLWKGVVKKPTFREFRMDCVNSSTAAQNVLQRMGMEQCWKMAERDATSEKVEKMEDKDQTLFSAL